MAEFQYTTYKADVTSFELRQAMLGVVESGRYRGYSDITTGGAKVGIAIPILINHTTSGIQKGDMANPPALGDKTGIIISPQGTIIHNTNLDITVSIDDGIGQSGDRYDLIYIEHEYYSVKGSNASIIGVKKGTDGAGVPTLAKLAEQVAIIQVKIVNTAATFGSLQFTVLSPAKIGDYEIDTEIQDVIDNIIGDRQYTEDNYVTTGETITDSIDALDINLKDRALEITALQTTKLDDWATPDDNTDLDATTSYHGLLKKLPGVSSQFLDGTGNWNEAPGKYIKWRAAIPSGDDFAYDEGVGGIQNFDLSSIINDSDADLVIIEVFGYCKLASTGPIEMGFHEKNISSNTSSRMKLQWEITNTYVFAYRTELTVKMDSTQNISAIMMSGILSNLDYLGFKVKGWQTPNV